MLKVIKKIASVTSKLAVLITFVFVGLVANYTAEAQNDFYQFFAEFQENIKETYGKKESFSPYGFTSFINACHSE